MFKGKIFTIVSPESSPISKKVIMDWACCFICQADDSVSQIVSPFKSPNFARNPENSSYYSTAENLKRFQEINELPPVLQKQVEQYENASELASEFVNHQAIFHKNCITNYDKHTFERKIKRKKESITTPETPPTSRNFESAKNLSEKCFFCDDIESNCVLHNCLTLYVDVRVRKIARELSDTKLLAKLSEGDMIALEAKYHLKCLVKFYNRYRNHNARKSQEKTELETIQGIALFELVSYIEETINLWDESTVPVFRLQDLKSLYKKNLIKHGVSAELAESVHTIRFKQQILENVPALCESKDEKKHSSHTRY